MLTSWKDSIREQRSSVFELLLNPVRQLAGKCQKAWPDREALTEALLADFDSIPYCTYLYVVDTRGIQFSDNVSRDGRLPEHGKRPCGLLASR